MGPLGSVVSRAGMIDATVTPASSTSKPDANKLADSSRQFEALMIGQILKSAHGSGSEGWLGDSDDDSSTTAIQMAEEYLGQAIANSGGLGIAKMVIQGVDKGTAKP